MFLSVRDDVVRWVGYSTVFEGLRDLGISSFELFINRDLKVASDLYVGSSVKPETDITSEGSREILKRHLRDADLNICAILLENDFSSENLRSEINYVLSAIEVASDLEVNIIRINAVMRLITGYDLEKYVRRVENAIRECMGICHNLGVSLAIENHGVIANKREFLRLLFQRIDDEHLGLTLDTGNFYWFGYPLSEVYEIVNEFASKVKHTHIKNAIAETNKREVFRGVGEVRMAPLYQGDIDLKRVVRALKEAGYNYDLTVEDESLGMFEGEERLTVLRKDVEFIRKLV